MPFTYTDDSVVRAIHAVVRATPCPVELNDTGWCAVPKEALLELKRQLGFIEATNQRARDIKYLNEMVHEVSQTAANPRPLCGLLHDLAMTQMNGPGMPGFKESPQIRLVLHQLLHLSGYFGHPAYECGHDHPRKVDYGKDADAVAQLYCELKAREHFELSWPEGDRPEIRYVSFQNKMDSPDRFDWFVAIEGAGEQRLYQFTRSSEFRESKVVPWTTSATTAFQLKYEKTTEEATQPSQT